MHKRTRLFPVELILLASLFALSPHMNGQSSPRLPQVPLGMGRPSHQPVSLQHIYWHYLVYQSFLDEKAADLDAHGKNGAGLKNHLQVRLAFTDAEYAPVHTSAARLAGKLKLLDATALSIQKGGLTPDHINQLRKLSAERESYISSEISYLKQTLPQEKIKTLEVFMTQFFSPKQVAVQLSKQPVKSSQVGVR